MSEYFKELSSADVGANEGVYDVDSIADMFADGEGGGLEEEAAAEDMGEDTENVDAEEAQEPQEPEEGQNQDEPEPEIPMPEGWEDAVWQGLTPEARNAVNAREQAHAQAVSQMRAEQQAVKQQQEQFAIAANAQIQQALAAMKQVMEGEYGGVNWAELAQSDPAAYVRLQQAYAQRMSMIQQVQQGVAQATRQYEAQRANEAKQAIAAEFAQVQPEIKAMMGAGFEGKKFAADLAQYMQEQGCPPEVINGLSRGYEVKLIAKAMLYDKLLTQRAAATKKVAEAPRVQAPRGAAPVDNSRAAKARALLNKDPNSTDALAALFEAM